MKVNVFVVRVNPDLRKGRPYSSYPSIKEYDENYTDAVMDGFEEGMNFLSESGSIKGYLPPRSSALIKEDPFILITVTAKTANNIEAKEKADKIVGIQLGCRYVGDNERTGGVDNLEFTYNYRCSEKLSFLFDVELPEARELVIEDDRPWYRSVTYQIKLKKTFYRILNFAEKNGSLKVDDINKIKAFCFSGGKYGVEFEGNIIDREEAAVSKILISNKKLENVVGVDSPIQKEVLSYRYSRDPKVVAYALQSAAGVCGDCGENGPFIAKGKELPFLEVHHVKQLKDGGSDTVDNVVALCPNCHRKRHYG